MRWMTRHITLFAVAALVGAAGCANPDPPPTAPPAPSGTSSLDILAATPASGNGTLTGITAVLEDVTAATVAGELGGVASKRVRIRGTTPGKEHLIEVYFVPPAATPDRTVAEQPVETVTHQWATDVDATPPSRDAMTGCGAGGTACNPAVVTIDPEVKRVNFIHLVMPDLLGGSNTSTLHGVVYY